MKSLRETKLFVRLYRAAIEFGEDDGSFLAAGAAYFFGLSIFPLLSVLIAAFGLFLQYTGTGRDAEAQLMGVVERNLSPMLAEQTRSALEQVQTSSSTGGLLGLIALVVAASAGFAQFQHAFDKIWDVRVAGKPGVASFVWQLVVERGAALLMMLAVAAILVAAFIATTALTAVQRFTDGFLPAPGVVWTLAQTGVSLAINAVAFACLYRFLPKRDVPWRHAWQGAALVAIGWEVGRRVLESFLIGTQYTSAYGIVGAFLSVLVWGYYGSLLILFGAEFVHECQVERPSTEELRGD